MSGFRTKIRLGSNAQAIQNKYTITDLSGTTVFGTEYSALTSGVDLETVQITSVLANVNTTFSGDAFTTLFTFPDSRMVIASESLDVITDQNSGITQTAIGFEASESIELDGNTVNTAYTGSTFDFTVTDIDVDNFLGWSGTANSSVVQFLSGSSLDYQERTIWVDVKGITKTDKLILDNEPETVTGLTESGVTTVLAREPSGDVVQVEISGDKHYKYNQGLPAAVWTITHNLNKYPSVIVINSVNDVVEGHIEYVDLNNIILTFTGAFSGDAIFN